MRPHVLVRSGACTGTVVHLQGERIRIGRRPDLELRLDAERDLEASALHAELRRVGNDWYLADLGSRNGTFLNGRIVGREPRPLQDRDEFRLGARGPLLEFRSGAARSGPITPTAELPAVVIPPAIPGAAAADSPQAAPPAGPPPAHTIGPPPPVHAHATARLRWTIVGLAGLLLVVVAGSLWTGLRRQADWESERALLEARADSLLEAGERSIAALEGELSELSAALRGSRSELASIHGALAEARTRPEAPSAGQADPEVEALEARLREVTAALELQQLAASLDFSHIQASNRHAIALLWVERPDGTVASGTAFGVTTGGILATSRHVVIGESGTLQPERIALQFADSRQVFPGRLLGVSPDWDVALIRVENLEGTIPVVEGLNLRGDTLPSGTPLATLGFPLGGEAALSAEGERPPARPLLGAGVLRSRSGPELEIQGYGEPGASGSPVFDATGTVVGILYGGRTEGSARILHAAPTSALVRLIEAWERDPPR